MLLDSAHIQEEEANFRNRHHFSKHSPAKPLYTVNTAKKSLSLFKPLSPAQQAEIGDIQASFHPNGHILGSSYLDICVAGKHVLFSGEPSIKIFGRYYDVKAKIENLDFLSAHANRDELIRWLQKMPTAPKHCFVTHGEADAADHFPQTLNEALGWRANVPEQGSAVVL